VVSESRGVLRAGSVPSIAFDAFAPLPRRSGLRLSACGAQLWEHDLVEHDNGGVTQRRIRRVTPISIRGAGGKLNRTEVDPL
jgi:hypothetical protein